MSVQVEPQSVAAHMGEQRPRVQVRPAPQATPQLPQLAGSDVVSTQVPPHRVAPAGQAVPVQTPPMQL